MLPLRLLAFCLLQDGAPAQDVIFSGPQKGERVPPFVAIDVTGGRKERVFDPTKEAGDNLAVYVMFTGPARPVTRSIANIDCIAREINVAAKREKRQGVMVYYVLLAPDRIEGAARLRHVFTGITPEEPASIAADGPEGPGNWGLHRKCQLTVVIAKESKVLFNLTTTSPGDREDDAIREALSTIVGHACTSRPNWARSGESPMMGGGMGSSMMSKPETPASKPASAPAKPRPSGI